MNRSLVIVLGACALIAAFFGSSYLAGRQFCTRHAAGAGDDLAWLRDEFHLGPADLARVRQLHEGYLPHCAEMCARIAAKKRELEESLAGSTNVTDAARQKLVELGELRAQCQAQMLQHFVTVSQAMPPEQGRRYLAEMQRLTVGSHDAMEDAMSGSPGHVHGHP